ncbi:hypothetical protein FSP39_020187 [Pinctada imbricata]|uniref:Uncharacterized protein n=1 Tax=Pinctada imbricata TaxID=66713 RepID=A0AA88XTI9_PINIB|nr:hypothetical protein FSP39_020187 [Pinctada imbricata]
MEVEKTKTGDFLKFLRYAPVVYPFICGVQERILEKTDLTRKESMFFRSMARFMSLSELPDHDRPPGNTSLLHVACCTDKKDFVKMIAESPVTPDIMAKTSNKLRAIDISSSFGHWTVVQYLLEKSASFSCETLLACAAKEKYMGTLVKNRIGIWARHLVYITESETASDKSRTKIFKELCKQKDLDLTYSTPENGSILFNAMQNQLNDIVDFIIEKNQTVLMKVLNEEAQITKYIPKCKSKTLASITGIVERHLTKVKPQSLGKLLISLSSQKNNDELINLTVAMKRSVTFDVIQDILSETDEHGRTALHYTAIHGHKSACKALVKCTRSSKQQEIYGQIINREDSSRTPALWYAMANGHWEVANILLLAGASPVLIRSVPDFRPRRHFKNGSALPESNKSSEYKIPMRKTFPLLVNSSFDVGPCINPGVELFEERTDASTESPNDVQRQKTESSALKIIQT